MTEFYRSIARHYDDIFPLSDNLKQFLLSLGIRKNDHVLDIGCATGEVALFLSLHGKGTTGIDLDKELIQIAFTKQKELAAENVRFLVGDMNDLGVLSPDQFQFVLCLGNTLVHLVSPEFVDRFFKNIADILSDGGRFIFQILNYTKILTRKTVQLPIIDNEKITFERRYDHEVHKPLLAFNTRLIVKTTSEIIDNSIDLYPLQQTELLDLSSKQLFGSVQFLGGFDGQTFSKEADLLIGIWEK
jgi:SAM-dependent methyltransferase